MPAADTIGAKLNDLLASNWSAIVADAEANKGTTRIAFSVVLKKNPDGTFAFDISQSFKVRQEVSAPKTITAKGIAYTFPLTPIYP